MSDSVRPHRWQPTRLPRPWDSPGKNTGVGCHFLLQCVKVKSESEVAQSCPTLHDPIDGNPPGSSVHRLFQARVLEWVVTAFSNRARLSLYLMSVFISISKLQTFKWHTTWQSNFYLVCTLVEIVLHEAPNPWSVCYKFLRERCSVTFGSVYKWKAMQPE